MLGEDHDWLPDGDSAPEPDADPDDANIAKTRSKHSEKKATPGPKIAKKKAKLAVSKLFTASGGVSATSAKQARKATLATGGGGSATPAPTSAVAGTVRYCLFSANCATHQPKFNGPFVFVFTEHMHIFSALVFFAGE